MEDGEATYGVMESESRRWLVWRRTRDAWYWLREDGRFDWNSGSWSPVRQFTTEREARIAAARAALLGEQP